MVIFLTFYINIHVKFVCLFVYLFGHCKKYNPLTFHTLLSCEFSQIVLSTQAYTLATDGNCCVLSFVVHLRFFFLTQKRRVFPEPLRVPVREVTRGQALKESCFIALS